MKIGLLEDNPAILDYMTTALQMAGYSVEAHTTSASLLDSLLTGEDLADPLPYDVVIVDLLLPGNIPGLAAIEDIHRLISPERLPIIIISACSQVELEQVKEKLPDVPVLRKPFKMNTLLQLIEKMKPS
jgi:two-component system, OmpR family, response regulator